MTLFRTALLFFASSVLAAAEPSFQPQVHVLQPAENVQYQLQSLLINAVPGDVIEIPAGTFHFDTELNVACDHVTLRGAGRDKTVLSFRGQQFGSAGIQATGQGFVIEHLAVEDSIGNAVKVIGARDVTFRDVRVEWTGGEKPTNGAYGIYPVECRNVLIEDCVVFGASDAGIYVGQSEDVVVRRCRAERNVAGIEIENTVRADVYENIATKNTGGIMVFDLPGLNLKNGRQTRVFKNQIHGNNHENFAPRGTMVADVPPGTGVMLLAANQVEVFENEIRNNQTCNVLLISFLSMDRKIKDEKYDPYCEAISIHDNRITEGGKRPAGQLSLLLGSLLGVQFPDILYDGWVDPQKLRNGTLPPELGISIRNNGLATFTNFRVKDLNPANVLSGKYQFSRDLTPYAAALAALPAVELKPHSKPSASGNSAVKIYRSAPPLLSAWKLYQRQTGSNTGDASRPVWLPEPEWLPYELNTALFSDDTLKHRYIRLPAGNSIRWTDQGSLEFPVGTVIAKTFAYPDATRNQAKGSKASEDNHSEASEHLVETRIELRDNTGWYGYSYVWRTDQSDAELRLGGGALDVVWQDHLGTEQKNHYSVPNANQCLSCHGQNGVFVPLGTTAVNLNRRDHSGQFNQLEHWIQQGKLTGAPDSYLTRRLPAYLEPQSGTVEERARAWLDVNCAHCHNPLGSARTTGMDLRREQTDAGKLGVWKTPVATGKGSGGRRYDIVPGKPDESILLFRTESTEPGIRMPNLARNRTHPAANALIREWIEGLR